ncbi:RND efflux system, outer membrane lipoprotein, NodT family [Rhizobium sp. CF080]|uniref:efflux transporter outer membrane subunit n=1 Tax=Rhizobium sp. (strain CF080) TaxID=1144310 RepID=UPI0002715619|nr:efflux transporter outer membrane subunit [Rhizobium sp. CF080]EUB99968.1 RND efflux system, outer membrane lipoprotein, NodT family [Rhizobium sp. CF080]
MHERLCVQNKTIRGCVTSRTALLLFTLVLSSCVVGPDYESPKPLLPASWNSRKDKASSRPPELHQWWKRLQDPVLNDLVARAVQGNLDVATAKAKIREARATTQEQVGGLFPTLSSSGSTSRSRSTGSSVNNQYQAGFDSSWEIDLFGANRRAIEAAKYGEEASEAELRDTLVTLVGDVAAYYVQVREYQELIELAERSAKSQRQTASLTRELQKAGEVTEGDVAKAEAQAAYTEADIPSYQTSYAQSVHRLSLLLGQSPSALDEVLTMRKKIPLPPKPTSLGIPADLLVNRPDVRVAERQLAQSTARIGQAQADRYPSIGLTGSIDSSAGSLSDLGRNSTVGWSLGPNITIPLFQGGRLKAAVDVAKAQRDQYLIAYQSTILSAMEDVQNAIIATNQSRLKQSKLALSAMRFRRALQVSRELHQAGVTDFFTILDTERSLYSVEEDLIETRSDVATYYIALHKALGGGWDGEIDASKPATIDVGEEPHLIRAKRGG